jgi:hypothetical protein
MAVTHQFLHEFSEVDAEIIVLDILSAETCELSEFFGHRSAFLIGQTVDPHHSRHIFVGREGASLTGDLLDRF